MEFDLFTTLIPSGFSKIRKLDSKRVHLIPQLHT